ncbi:MAG: hypothetical protein ACOC1F_00590 [Myxococcota bacterium]
MKTTTLLACAVFAAASVGAVVAFTGSAADTAADTLADAPERTEVEDREKLADPRHSIPPPRVVAPYRGDEKPREPRRNQGEDPYTLPDLDDAAGPVDVVHRDDEGTIEVAIVPVTQSSVPEPTLEELIAEEERLAAAARERRRGSSNRVDPADYGFSSEAEMEAAARDKLGLPEGYRVSLFHEQRDGKDGVAMEVVPPAAPSAR